ncbi:putative indole-3-pyruvate monooxygenase YUCCA10 [Carex rostrata]
MDREVVIVGAGPAGIATAACLNLHSIPNIVLEKEDCLGSLWKKNSYDCLNLHLGKRFCQLPYLALPQHAPNFISKADFIKYLDEYAENFRVTPKYQTCVKSAFFDKESMTWHVVACNGATGETEEYSPRFLVVATGENAEGVIPEVPGLHTFQGEVIHSYFYKSGEKYNNKRVLVVGCGNSGMEIAHNLATHGAKTSIVVRNPFHIMTKEQIFLGMKLVQYLPFELVDTIIVTMARFTFGDLSNYGIVRPKDGPLVLKARSGRSAVLDVGTVQKIKNGEIKVYGPVSSVEENNVLFMDGKSEAFDAIIFATGYKSTANKWLEDGNETLDEDGFPKKGFPNQWKGSNGLYCSGFARRGLAGISMDAISIADDIKKAYK